MRHDKIIAAGPIGSARFHPLVYTCTCCETVAHSASPAAPADWAIEYIDGKGYALCGDCKIDLPESDRPAGVTATRAGIPSQLDVECQFEWDQDDILHAQRLIAIARAERIGRAVMPVLLGAIALIGSASIVQHSLRWIVV